MDAHIFLREFITEPLDWLQKILPGHPITSDEARLQLLATAGQESHWTFRVQVGGPAHSFWQFEAGGGVWAVLNHPIGSLIIRAACQDLSISFDRDTIYAAMAWNDKLALAVARIRLWIDSEPLPAIGDQQGGWNMYHRIWAPGAPDPKRWAQVYAIALEAIRNTGAPSADPIAPLGATQP